MATILGASPAVQELLKLIHKVSVTKTNILVIGESGTGKELVARMIHDSSPLKGKPFVPVNCGAIPENLIESEMFGHRKGAFTGAVGEKSGLFEAANGGSLFLDEVGELPLPMQVKLLRAIQERVFKKVGGTEDVRVDVRIIAATNRDLEAGVKAGTFREDLYYRLNVIQIKTPPLRVRKGDIRILAEAFMEKFSKKFSKQIKSIDPDAMVALERHIWPGNVRELENVIERAVTLANGDVIVSDILPPNVLGANAEAGAKNIANVDGDLPGGIRLPPADFVRGPLDLTKILHDVERAYILGALEKSAQDQKAAAILLGLSEPDLKNRLERLEPQANQGLRQK